MPIRRSFEFPFTAVRNEVIDDGQITWAAKGLYCYLVRQGDGWSFELNELDEFGPPTNEPVDQLLDQLQSVGAIRWEHGIIELVGPQYSEESPPPDPPDESTSDRPSDGWVYVMSNPAFDPVKVGYTTRHPENRREELNQQSAAPYEFDLFYSRKTESPRTVEQRAHEILSAYRTSGEFFHVARGRAKQAVDEAYTQVDGGDQ